MTVSDTIRLARPGHWIKNVIVLFPVIFSQNMGSATAWLQGAIAMAAFCFASAAAYIVNDVQDRRSDRLHPGKRDRPVAAGRVSVAAALVEAAVLMAAAGAIAGVLGCVPLLILAGYVVLQVAYTFVLKRLIILDVMCIAVGFVLRAAFGAAVICVEPSPWLIICTFTVCLFMGFCKRRIEAVELGNGEQAELHRPTLALYTPELLTHLTTLSASVALIAYMLYATNPMTVERFGTIGLVYTLPIVIYAVFRFEMLSTSGRYVDPTDLILHDRPFQVTVLVWLAAVGAIISWGRDMGQWLRDLV